MIPVRHATVTPHQIPTVEGDIMEWSNNDEDFVVTLNMVKGEIKGEYHKFDEDLEDWIDGEAMTDEDLTTRINNGEFLAVDLVMS